MRKLQFALVAVLMAATTSVAAAQQPPQGQRQGGGRNMMPMLLQGITLTAEQQAKVDSISKKFDDQRTALRADQNLDMDTRRTKNREIMQKQSDEVKAVLTDEQKKVFEKNQADMQARMQGGGRPPR